jgi:hypothetical protein
MIVEMDHPLMGRVRARSQHTAHVLRDEPGASGAGRAELTQAGTAYDKHPEAGP